MSHAAITQHIDVAQVTLYAFWAFFALLILYLRREDKREGYPLDSDRVGVVVRGYPEIPDPNPLNLGHEGWVVPKREERDLTGILKPVAGWPGAPMTPVGNPLQDGVGPASYALRNDAPEVTFDDHKPKIVPLAAAPGYYLAPEDPDPRGFKVVTADRKVAGTVVEVWIDRSETHVRYFEAEAVGPTGPRRVVFPSALARIDGRRKEVKVKSVLASQFVEAPALKNSDSITAREEDRVSAYFAGGHLYATPLRTESFF